jgi:aminopeptidase N
MVFLMLCDRLGEAAFRKGIQDFWVQQRFRVALWQDLRRAFERASGEKLVGFFATWVDTRGVPQIAVEAASSQPLGKHNIG